MTRVDLLAMLPLIVLCAGAVGVTLLIAVWRHHTAAALFTYGALALAWASVFSVSLFAPRQSGPLIVIDQFGLFYIALVVGGAMAVTAFAHDYLEKRGGRREEFYALLLLATAGAALLVTANHFASFFLALEILSVALYGMIAFTREREQSIEAGFKYLVLAAASAAFLLFGMALVYWRVGSLAFSALADRINAGVPGDRTLLAGMGLIVVGFGFKLAVAPFHLWTADVYEGAPAPTTAFIATISKGAMFALLLRVFGQFSGGLPGVFLVVFAAIATASMFVGNLLALLQTNVKRMLAYSSIAHLGYLMVAFLASGRLAMTAATFYLAAYFVTTLGAFGVVSVMSEGGRDADRLDDYRGLAWREPWLAAVFMAMLFSLAGIPLTAGFVGKFYVLAAGVRSSLWFLAVVLVINSAIGLYYYLRVVVAMIEGPVAALDGEGAPASVAPTPVAPPLALASGAMLAALLLLLVWLGVYPSPLLEAIRSATIHLP